MFAIVHYIQDVTIYGNIPGTLELSNSNLSNNGSGTVAFI